MCPMKLIWGASERAPRADTEIIGAFRYRNVLSRDCPCMEMDTYSCMQNNEQSNIEKKHIQPFYFSEKGTKEEKRNKSDFLSFPLRIYDYNEPVRVCACKFVLFYNFFLSVSIEKAERPA